MNPQLNNPSQEDAIMTAEPSEKKTGKILTPAEREFCQKIATQGGSLHSQRAEALLLVDEGITQANACAMSDLSIGQLRYALTLFRKTGMQMFPKEATPPIAEEETVLIEPEEPAEEVIDSPEPVVKTVKEKKETKSSKKKKAKDKKKKKVQPKVDKPKKKKKEKKKTKVEQPKVTQPNKTKKKKKKKKK